MLTSAKPVANQSGELPRRVAASTPSGIDTITADTMLAPASSSVAGQPLEHQPQGVGAVLERLAEVALRGAFEEAHVLDGQGLIEAEAAADVVDVLGPGVGGTRARAGSPER